MDAAKEARSRYRVNYRSLVQRVYKGIFRGSTVVDISSDDESPKSCPQRSNMRKNVAPMHQIQRFVPERIVTGW